MPEGAQGVIGYMLQPDLAGRGLETDLAYGLLTAAFDVLQLRRVTASCNADNVAPARVLEKNGIEDSWHADLGWVDGYQYAMLDREWAPARTV